MTFRLVHLGKSQSFRHSAMHSLPLVIGRRMGQLDF
jgi:hypothetical protein